MNSIWGLSLRSASSRPADNVSAGGVAVAKRPTRQQTICKEVQWKIHFRKLQIVYESAISFTFVICWVIYDSTSTVQYSTVQYFAEQYMTRSLSLSLNACDFSVSWGGRCQCSQSTVQYCKVKLLSCLGYR